MTLLELKALLALPLLAAAVVAAATMFTVMGRAEKRAGPERLRAVHRAAGYSFLAIVIVLAALGVRHLSVAGDGLPVRGVLHWVLALFLAVVLGLKIAVVRAGGQLQKLAPALGVVVLALAFVVAGMSAGFFVIAGEPRPSATIPARAGEALPIEQAEGDVLARGASLFAEHCASCHRADSEEWKVGPGLRGLFQGESLMSTGLPPTRESVTNQIVAPAGSMPAFGSVLGGSQVAAIVTYLEGL